MEGYARREMGESGDGDEWRRCGGDVVSGKDGREEDWIPEPKVRTSAR